MQLSHELWYLRLWKAEGYEEAEEMLKHNEEKWLVQKQLQT